MRVISQYSQYFLSFFCVFLAVHISTHGSLHMFRQHMQYSVLPYYCVVVSVTLAYILKSAPPPVLALVCSASVGLRSSARTHKHSHREEEAEFTPNLYRRHAKRICSSLQWSTQSSRDLVLDSDRQRSRAKWRHIRENEANRLDTV